MTRKKLIGIIIIIVIIIVIIIGACVFINNKNQAKEAAKQAQITEQTKENNLKQEQLKAQEAKDTTKDNKTEQTAQTTQSKEKTTQPVQNNKAPAQTKQVTQTNQVKQNNQTSQSTKQTNNDLSQEKAQLLDELSTLKPQVAPGTHYGQLTQSELLYTTWDDELNKIWQILEKNLPQNQMEALRQNEVQWINTKAPYMPAYNAAASGNYSQMQSVQAGQTLAQMTKDRCYYLVNNYM